MKNYLLYLLLIVIAVVSGFGYSYVIDKSFDFNSEHYKLKPKVIIDELNHPWAITWLESENKNHQELLITERNGDILYFSIDNNKIQKRIKIKPPVEIFQNGQGGLLDIKTHPNYSKNKWIYLTYSAKSADKSATSLARFRIKDYKIKDWQLLFTDNEWSATPIHFGSNIAFDNKGFVYITIGDRGRRYTAQSLKYSKGKVIRLHDDGRLPKDNPFSENKAIYSYGHRNPQGLWFDNKKQELWLHEHGPRGGDELNLINKGNNYGWPIISYGNEYLSNLPVSKITHKKGMEQPIHYWIPSIAPSGLLRYQGDEFTLWNDDFLLGSLKFGELVRLRVINNKVIKEERLLEGKLGRIRAISQHNDNLFILTDSIKGKLIQLKSL
jgi:glucose/arabinose dehydrogenase